MRIFLAMLAASVVALLGLSPATAQAVQVRYRIGTPTNFKDVYIKPNAAENSDPFIPLTYGGLIPDKWVEYVDGSETTITSVGGLSEGETEKVYYARWNNEAADGPTAQPSEWRRFSFFANQSDVTDSSYESQFKDGGAWRSEETLAQSENYQLYREYVSGVRATSTSSGQLPYEIRLVKKYTGTTAISGAVEEAGGAHDSAVNNLTLRVNYFLPPEDVGLAQYVVKPEGWYYWSARDGLSKTFSFENRSAGENESVVYDDGQDDDFTLIMRMNHNSEYVANSTYFTIRYVSLNKLVAVQAVMRAYNIRRDSQRYVWTPQAIDPAQEITAEAIAQADASRSMNTWLVQRDLTSPSVLPGGYSQLSGWSTENGGETAYSFFPDTGTPTIAASSKLTLYAMWEKTEYNLDLDLSGGSFAEGAGSGWSPKPGGRADEFRYDTQFNVDTSTIELPNNTGTSTQLVAPSGHDEFLGWYLQDGTGPIESVPDDIPAEALGDTASITLVAKWSRAVKINVYHYVRQLAGDDHNANVLADSVVKYSEVNPSFSEVGSVGSKANARVGTSFAEAYATGEAEEYVSGTGLESLRAAAEALQVAGYEYSGKFRAVLPTAQTDEWIDIFPERVPNLNETLINVTPFVPDSETEDPVLDLYLYYTPRIFHISIAEDGEGDQATATAKLDKLATTPIEGTSDNDYTGDYYVGAKVKLKDVGVTRQGYGLPITWAVTGGSGEPEEGEGDTGWSYVVAAPATYDPNVSNIQLTPSSTYISYADVTFYTGPNNEQVGNVTRVRYGDRVSVPYVISSDGTVADYWTTTASPTGQVFDLSSALTQEMTDDNDRLSLYAWWDDPSDNPAVRRTVRFVSMGRTVASVNVLAGAQLGSVLNASEMSDIDKTRFQNLFNDGVTRAGTSFIGWYPLAVDGGYADTAFAWDTTIDRDTTLYAKYKAFGPEDDETPTVEVGPDEFVVAFKIGADDARPYAVKVVRSGGSLTSAGMPSDPDSVADKHFAGWVLNGRDFDGTTTVNSDVTVLAQMVDLHTVRFKARLYNRDAVTLAESDEIILGSPVTVLSGKTVAAPDVSMTGYDLSGWYEETNGTLASNAYRFATPVTSDLTLVAKMVEDDDPSTSTIDRAQRAYVTFMSAGLLVNVVDVRIDEEDVFSAPRLSRTDYTLDRWCIGSVEGDEFRFDTSTSRNIDTVSRDTLLVADWTWSGTGEEPDPETGGGGSGGNGTQHIVKYVSEGRTLRQDTVDAGSTVPVPSFADLVNSRDHSLVVIGWSEDPSEHATVAYDFSQPITRDLTLYVRWGAAGQIWTVSFDSNGGTSVQSQFVDDGAYATEPTPTPVQVGYTLRGWFKGTENNSFDFAARAITENVRLSARWNVAPVSLPTLVTFMSDGEVLDIRETGENGLVEPLMVMREGSTLEGWYDNASYTGEAINFAARQFTESTIVYAKWAKDSTTPEAEDIVKVSFYAYNAESADPYMVELVQRGGRALEPAAPRLLGHTFGYWAARVGESTYSPFNFVTDETSANYRKSTETVGENIELYAIWSDLNAPIGDDVCIVAFVDEGREDGEIIHIEYVTSGGTINDPTQTLREEHLLEDRVGFTMSGWVTDDNEEFDFENDTVTSNLTLTKHYTAIPYTITYTSNGSQVRDPATYTIESGDVILPTMPSSANYTFLGWTIEVDGDGAVSPNGLGTGTYAGIDGEIDPPLPFYSRVSRGSWGNLKAVARWEPTRYQVQLLNNGESSGILDVIFNTAIRYYAPDSTAPIPVTSTEGFARPTRDDLTVHFVGNGGTVNLAAGDTRPQDNTVDSERTIPFVFDGYRQLGGAQQLMLVPSDGSSDSPVVLSNVFSTETTLTGVSECTFVAGWEMTSAANGELPVAVRPGYSFDGWYSTSRRGSYYGDSGDTYDFGTTYDDITMYAAWTPQDYTITYKQRDGVTNDGTVTLAGTTLGNATQTYRISNTNVALAQPVAREGYTFRGWQLELADSSAAGRVPDPNDGPYQTINLADEGEGQRAYGNLVATPVWEAHKYVITLDLSDLRLTNPNNAPATKKLVGTYGDADDGGVKLALATDAGEPVRDDGNNEVLLSGTQGLVVPLRDYLVQFDGNSPRAGRTVSGVDEDRFGRVTYYFDGYYVGDVKIIDATGHLVALSDDGVPTAAGQVVNGWSDTTATRDLTLTPKWRKNSATGEYVTGTIGFELPTEVPTINDDSYEFDGWGLETNTANARRVQAPETLPIDGSTSEYDGSSDYIVFVYAQWRERDAYTITYESAGPQSNTDPAWDMTAENMASHGVYWLNASDSRTNPNLTSYKSSNVYLTNPASNGYTFSRWVGRATNTSDDEAQAVIVQNDSGAYYVCADGTEAASRGDLTLTAEWESEPNSYRVTAYLDGGAYDEAPSGWTLETEPSRIVSGAYSVESSPADGMVVVLPNDASQIKKRGYTFAGWRLDGGAGTTSDDEDETALRTSVARCRWENGVTRYEGDGNSDAFDANAWLVAVVSPADVYGGREQSYRYVVIPAENTQLDDAIAWDGANEVAVADPAATVGVIKGSWGDSVVSATWAARQYTVSFDKNFDGSGTDSEAYTLPFDGQLALSNVSPYLSDGETPANTRSHTIRFDLVYRDPASADPTKTVTYDFAGWSLDEGALPDDTENVYPHDAMLRAEDIINDPDNDTGATLHAIWDTDPVQLPSTSDYPAFLSRDGYGLAGWVDDEEVARELTGILSKPEASRTPEEEQYLTDHPLITEVVPSQDTITVYAVWSGTLYPITYRSMVASEGTDVWQLSVAGDMTGLARDNGYGLTWPSYDEETMTYGEYAADNPNPNPAEFMAVSLGNNDSVLLVDPARKGYKFLGWTYGWDDGRTLHKASDSIPAAIPAQYFPTSELGAIVTAHWEVETDGFKLSVGLPTDGLATVEVTGTVDAYELQTPGEGGVRDASFKTAYTIANKGTGAGSGNAPVEMTIQLPAGTYTVRLVDAGPWFVSNVVDVSGPWARGYTTSTDRVSNLVVDSTVGSNTHAVSFTARTNRPANGNSSWALNTLDTNAT